MVSIIPGNRIVKIQYCEWCVIGRRRESLGWILRNDLGRDVVIETGWGSSGVGMVMVKVTSIWV